MAAIPGPPRAQAGGGGYVGRDLTVGRDYIGRDQNLYQYFQGGPGLAVPPARPYVVDRPFKVEEERLFTGREEPIERALDQMADPERRAIVLYGPADVGKTSLLTAGLLPRLDLLPQTTAVVTLRAYGQASAELRRQVQGSARGLGLDLPEETPLPEAVAALTQAPGRRLLLILDQFERFFQPGVSEAQRLALRADLCAAMEAAEPARLQILIAIRDDVQAELDRGWGDLLPGLRDSPLHVRPFSRDQARRAILHPVQELRVQPVWDDALVDGRLLDDLDRLSFEQPGSILPADLGAVCSSLWQAARDKPQPTIDTAFYYQVTDGKGAEQIIDRRFDGLLARIGAGRRDLARAIATALLDREAQTWLTPEELSPEGADPVEVQATLDEMSAAELVVWHGAGGRQVYTLASDSIARAADRALGRQAQKRRQARWELEHAWRDWLADDTLAGRYSLNLIQREKADGPPPPERGLFLLASAVARRAPVDPWLKQLETDAGRDLIRGLEEGQAGPGTSTPHSQAGRLLGLADEEDLPPRPPSAEFGAVAWSAAAHRKKAACRETAALALLAGYGPDALGRVEAAVKGGRLGRGRLAELHGTLADASPAACACLPWRVGQGAAGTSVAARLRTAPRLDRLAAWAWRFRRRVVRDLPYLGSLALGGAVGAGLGLGVLRALLAPLVQEKPGYAFYAAFAVASLFGLALSLGLLLANPICLRPPEHRTGTASGRPPVPAVTLGALLFAATQGLHNLLFGAGGLVAATMSALALLAGAGLSLAVHDQPAAGWRLGVRRWLPRLAAAAAALALVQAACSFVLNPDLGIGLVFAWTGRYYEYALRDNLVRWGWGGILAVPGWFHGAAVIDAGLTGIALALGLAAGLNVAGRWFEKWEALAERAGE